jgi:hypothetical protein
MKAVLAFWVLISGCSVLDRIDFESPQVPSARVDVEHEIFLVRRTDDLDRYRCRTAPLRCELAGSRWRCECP